MATPLQRLSAEEASATKQQAEKFLLGIDYATILATHGADSRIAAQFRKLHPDAEAARTFVRNVSVDVMTDASE